MNMTDMREKDLAHITRKVAQVRDIYVQKCDIAVDADWYALKLSEELGELMAEYLKLNGRGRTKGATADEVKAALEDECADVLAHVLLFAANQNIDLDSALERKWFKYLNK